MGDLGHKDSSQSVKQVGADVDGLETNYIGATSDNREKNEAILLGSDGATRADINDIGGVKRVRVESILGLPSNVPTKYATVFPENAGA